MIPHSLQNVLIILLVQFLSAAFLPSDGVAASPNLLLEALVCTMLRIITRSVTKKTTTNNRKDDI